MHVPAVPLEPAGTTHFAPVRQPGPMVGSLSHAAPSAAGAMHVPVVLVAGLTHCPPAAHAAKPVIGIAPISPQGAPAAASMMFWHVPTALPFAVGMQAR